MASPPLLASATPPGLVGPGELWTAWSWEPLVMAGLVLAAALYAAGVRALRFGRRRRAPAARHLAACYGGLAVLALALLSPLNALAETLFSAHMVQHLLLLCVVPPLLAYGRVSFALMLALPRPARRRVKRFATSGTARLLARVTTSAALVWILHTGVMWAWHLPNLYDSALTSEVLHVAEHVTFLGTAFALWALVVPTGPRRRLEHGVAILLVFWTALQSGALGAILVFASSALYPAHAAGSRLWGLTPLQDQQLAGAIMWIPAGFFYFATMAVLFAAWLKHMDKRADSPDRAPLATSPGER